MFKWMPRIICTVVINIFLASSSLFANPVTAPQGVVVDQDGKPVGPVIGFIPDGSSTVRVLTRIGGRLISLDLAPMINSNQSNRALVVRNRDSILYTGYGCTGQAYIGSDFIGGVNPSAQRWDNMLTYKFALIYISDAPHQGQQMITALSEDQFGQCLNYPSGIYTGGIPVAVVIDLYKHFKPPFFIR